MQVFCYFNAWFTCILKKIMKVFFHSNDFLGLCKFASNVNFFAHFITMIAIIISCSSKQCLFGQLIINGTIYIAISSVQLAYKYNNIYMKYTQRMDKMGIK
jgi:hypothetical protein